MPLPSAGVRAAQTSVRNNIAMLHVDGLKNGGPSAREIPLGAFLGACHFDAEILSFKIIWLEALFDAPKRTNLFNNLDGISLPNERILGPAGIR
jgi:hypothetical protein